jgi:hypothetical protein
MGVGDGIGLFFLLGPYLFKFFTIVTLSLTAEALGHCRGGGQAEAEPALHEPVLYTVCVWLQLKLEGVAGVADKLTLNPLSKNLSYMCFVTAEA